MLKRISFYFSCMLIAFLVVNCNQAVENIPEEETGESKLIPSDYFYQQRAYPKNTIDKKAVQNALAYRERTNKLATKRNTTWEFAGPINIGGRVTDIEMFPDDLNTIFVGAASGGIFKSTNQGEDWQPIFEAAASLSIGDMAIATDRTIYVGTGEANAGGGSLAYDGVGVYKSTDEGNNWEWKGLADVGSIGKVVVNPENENEVFVAAMGHLFENNAERGVYRSKDGGDNWEQVLFATDSTGAIDLVIDPVNPAILYAAMWERTRRPNKRQYGGETSGIYKSIDGGDTWRELENGLPSLPADKGRIGLAIAPSESTILMAIYADQFGDLEGIYKSTNAGTNWNQVGNVGSVPFMWWFGKIFIDPLDETKVFAPVLELYRSSNGGNSFTNVSDNMHVDQHALFIHPLNTNFVVAGNDGGVYISQNGGSQWTKKNTLPITQFYTCEIDFSQPNRLYGGTQDNNTIRTTTGDLDDWRSLFGGDGFRVLVDPQDNRFIYGEWQRGNLLRSTDGGLSFQNALNGIPNADRNNWNTPVAMDFNAPNTLYYGTQRVYKSTNRAISWQPISPDLTNGNQSNNITFGTLTTIDVSTVDGQIIYAGTDDGNVWNTLDGGMTWNNLSADLPNRWVTDVAADPIDIATAYAIFSGYRFGENIGHVYKTIDNGTRWTDITNNLPDVPLNAIIINPANTDHLFVASDIGVFETLDAGSNWQLFNENFPNVPVTDLDFHAPTNTLVAATYGRGLYQYELEETTTPVADLPSLDLDLKVFPNPVSEVLTIAFELEKQTNLTAYLVDNNGRKVKMITNQSFLSGKKQLTTDVRDMAGGAYFLVVESGIGQKTFALNILK